MTNEQIRPALESILLKYTKARKHEAFGKKHPLWADFERIAFALKTSEAARRFPTVTIKWSAGQGRWAEVPWIAALDSRETSKTSEGVYVIYLFRADMSGMHLTLNQGSSAVLAGKPVRGRAQLRARAASLRERSGALESAGFTVGQGIVLNSDATLIRSYEDSTVAFKEYARGSVPNDDALLMDFAAALATCDKLLPSQRWLRDEDVE